MLTIRAVLALALVASASRSTFAQGVEASSPDVSASTIAVAADFDGAPPPALPATISRDPQGRTTVRAVRLQEPLRLDGNLDEAIYRTVNPMSDFIQTEPRAGERATERTEVWIAFDDINVYVAVRATESQPDRMVVNEMRRDSSTIPQNENFFFAFDTFFDRRNSVTFQFNPLGGRMDGQVTNEGNFNSDWNPIWRLQVRRNESGLTAEAAVPFKSLRYRLGLAQTWGFQSRRLNRWKNEVSFLTPVPNGQGAIAFQRVSAYATLVGIEAPPSTRALDIKPYATSNVVTDRTTVPAQIGDFGSQAGVDAKYAVTQNLTGDFTYNTDFAQVEVDEQQVNLSRFNLFFPEKRDFFLENQGLFTFATTLGSTGNNNNSEVPTVFYSRRIGLDAGRPVPLDVGGRLSGRIGKFSIGMLDIATDDVEGRGVPSNNFGVFRVRRDVLRRGAVGAILTRRATATKGGGDALSYGVDGSFGFFENLSLNTYWARTQTPGVTERDDSYRIQMFQNGDRWGGNAEWLHVGRNFDPQVGFMRRTDFTKNRAMFRFTPRPRNHFKAVRKFGYQASIEYFENSYEQVETRERRAEFWTDFQSSDRFDAAFEHTYEFIPRPFEIAPGVWVPVDSYTQKIQTLAYQFGQHRPVSGTVSTDIGAFYGGTRLSVGYASGRVNVNPHLYFEPGVSVNRVELPYGEFTTTLATTRGTFTVTPMMFLSALLQYNSSNHTVGANVRLRWEYTPGSELFVVYNEGRDTMLSGAPSIQNRTFTVKVNRLLRFSALLNSELCLLPPARSSLPERSPRR